MLNCVKFALLVLATCLPAAIPIQAQTTGPADVALTIEVTGPKGHSILGLTQKDFRILEDGIVQEIVTFTPSAGAEEPAYAVTYSSAADPNRGFGRSKSE